MKSKNGQFFHLLQTSLLENELVSESDNICLISQQLLNDTKTTLMCGHSFNYKPLFNEVYNQKYHKVKTEIQHVYFVIKLNVLIVEKYRKVYYLTWKGLDRVNYVNSPQSMVMMCNTCPYTFKSGKRKGQACHKRCVGKYCSKCTYYMKRRKLPKTIINKIVSSQVNIVAKTLQTQSSLCNATIKTGLRKGLNCRHPAKYNGKCGIHKNKQN